MAGKYKLAVYLSTLTGEDKKPIEVKYFTDWYDFADYIKQCNLSRTAIVIHKWEYVE